MDFVCAHWPTTYQAWSHQSKLFRGILLDDTKPAFAVDKTARRFASWLLDSEFAAKKNLKDGRNNCKTYCCMTSTLTVRLPAALAREFKSRTKRAKTSPSAVLRRAAANYVRERKTSAGPNSMQDHIDAFAGTWDGYCSGEALLRKTRP